MRYLSLNKLCEKHLVLETAIQMLAINVNKYVPARLELSLCLRDPVCSGDTGLSHNVWETYQSQ